MFFNTSTIVVVVDILVVVTFISIIDHLIIDGGWILRYLYNYFIDVVVGSVIGIVFGNVIICVVIGREIGSLFDIVTGIVIASVLGVVIDIVIDSVFGFVIDIVIGGVLVVENYLVEAADGPGQQKGNSGHVIPSTESCL